MARLSKPVPRKSASKRAQPPARTAQPAARNSTRYSGQPILRVEDHRLLTGHGQFVDDIRLPGTAHMAMLRSPFAHAKIRLVDTSRASALPGVLAILTGPDVKDALGNIPVQIGRAHV